MSVARRGIASHLANFVSDKRTENKTIKCRHLILSNQEQTNNCERSNLKFLKISESVPFHFTNIFEFAASLHIITQKDTLKPETRMQQQKLKNSLIQIKRIKKRKRKKYKILKIKKIKNIKNKKRYENGTIVYHVLAVVLDTTESGQQTVDNQRA